MAWEDLEGEVGELFSGLGIPLGMEDMAQRGVHVIHRKGYGDTRSSPLKIPGLKPARRPWKDFSEEQKARAAKSNQSYMRQRRLKRRAATRAAMGNPTTCVAPGCHNLLSLQLRPGKVPTTCSRRCSKRAVYARVARKRNQTLAPEGPRASTCVGPDCHNLLSPYRRRGASEACSRLCSKRATYYRTDHRRRLEQRAAAHAAMGSPTTCVAPGCHNLLNLQPMGGKIPTTCSHRCANKASHLRCTGRGHLLRSSLPPRAATPAPRSAASRGSSR